jgi:acyl-CoA thioesterase FadM
MEMTAIDMIYHKDYTIHTYETDARGLAKTVTLLNYLQDAAGDHAGRLGLSVLDLFKRNMTWVLSRYHILVHRHPGQGERLEVTTWPSGKGGYFATRDFEVADGSGGPFSATSSWMIVGSRRKQPVKVDDVIDIPTLSISGPSMIRSARSRPPGRATPRSASASNRRISTGTVTSTTRFTSNGPSKGSAPTSC